MGQPTDFDDTLLLAAQAWVEQGTNPERNRTYRVCALPRTALFKGGLANPDRLDVNDADDWSCSGCLGETARSWP